MTRDEILNMPAGREMDALITEKVIDWHWHEGKMLVPSVEDKRVSWAATWDDKGLPDYLPEYSTDISAAWEVVEKMKDTFSEICIDVDKDWRCYFDNACASAETAPLAICRAALLAVMK